MQINYITLHYITEALLFNVEEADLEAQVNKTVCPFLSTECSRKP